MQKTTAPLAIRTMEQRKVCELAVYDLIEILMYRIKHTNGMEFVASVTVWKLISTLSGIMGILEQRAKR